MLKLGILMFLLDIFCWRLIWKGIKMAFRWSGTAADKLSDSVNNKIEGKKKKEEKEPTIIKIVGTVE